MSRLIDADALKELYSDCEGYSVPVNVVLANIEDMPTIEPEKICVAKVILTDEQVREAVENAKNEVMSVIESERKKGRWIPLSKRLPDDCTYYYATCKSLIDDRENWMIEGFYTSLFGFNPPPMIECGQAEIIAWMPKEDPEPYQEEGVK